MPGIWRLAGWTLALPDETARHHHSRQALCGCAPVLAPFPFGSGVGLILEREALNAKGIPLMHHRYIYDYGSRRRSLEELTPGGS
ncbi:MAG: hypothetical protein ACUVV3_10815, partial [Dehalococcoidia bacterium]